MGDQLVVVVCQADEIGAAVVVLLMSLVVWVVCNFLLVMVQLRLVLVVVNLGLLG